MTLRGDFERPPAPAESGDTDRATAMVVLVALPISIPGYSAETIANALDHLAAALAAAREQGRAEGDRLRERMAALAEEWEAEADEGERWLRGPHVSVSEAQEYPATIQQARSHAADLRAALEDR